MINRYWSLNRNELLWKQCRKMADGIHLSVRLEIGVCNHATMMNSGRGPTDTFPTSDENGTTHRRRSMTEHCVSIRLDSSVLTRVRKEERVAPISGTRAPDMTRPNQNKPRGRTHTERNARRLWGSIRLAFLVFGFDDLAAVPQGCVIPARSLQSPKGTTALLHEWFPHVNGLGGSVNTQVNWSSTNGYPVFQLV